MLFLRITPILPNWFVNISSPIFNIPFAIFFGATLLGIAPQTFIAVNTGVTISQLSDALLDSNSAANGNPLLNVNTIVTLFGIAFLALVPVLVKRWTGMDNTDNTTSNKSD